MARSGGAGRLAAFAAACALGCATAAASEDEAQGLQQPEGSKSTAMEALRSEYRKHLADELVFGWNRRQFGEREYMIGLPNDFVTDHTGRSLIVGMHGIDLDPYVMSLSFEPLLSLADGPIVVLPYGTTSFGVPLGWSTRSSLKTNGPDGPTCSNDSFRMGCGGETCRGKRYCTPCMPWYLCAPPCQYGTCIDDFAFLVRLLDEIELQYDIDPQKVFLTGFSQGGVMTWDAAGDSRLAHRFTAVATMHASPGAGFVPRPPTPESGPWLLGIWAGRSEKLEEMDPLMPPWSNVEGRPDKVHTITDDGVWYFSAAENATRTYAAGLQIPSRTISTNALMDLPWIKEPVQCMEDGIGGTVFRCIWSNNVHELSYWEPGLAYQFFLLAHQARYGSA